MAHFQRLAFWVAATLVLAGFASVRAEGPIMRLPPITADEPVSEPSAPEGILLSGTEPIDRLTDPPVPAPTKQVNEPPDDYRDGFFQKLLVTGAWFPKGGQESLGVSEMELQGWFALPCPTAKSPLFLIPGFGVHFMDGPAEPDLPARLYDAYLEFRWMSMLGEHLGAELSARPGVFSDFEQDADDALRIDYRAIGMWQFTPRFKLVAGAAYLDRENLTRLVPIGGALWTPTEEWRLDLIFPQPKVARRITCFGAVDLLTQDWLYVKGEFGNAIWSITRSSGASDVVESSDMRLLLGVERKAIGRPDLWVEVGYVFDREIEYVSDTPEYEPSDTLLLRAGVIY